MKAVRPDRVATAGLAAILAIAMAASPSMAESPGWSKSPALPVELTAVPVAMLVDLGSGQILLEHNPDKPFMPASMAKVMTAFVAFEEIESGKLKLNQKFTVKPNTAAVWNGRGTSMYLRSGTEITTDDLLRGIMTASANDASVVLADGYAGSVPAWTAMMNDAAQRIGMTNSRFKSPNGWPDEGQTIVTARDLVRLSAAMLRTYPGLYKRYAGKRTMQWERVTLFSHDPVIGVVKGADGIKTGYTREAGYNFLGSAERDGRRLVMVIAGTRSENQRARASRALLEWGFGQWEKRPLFGAGKLVGRARVQLGSAASVPLVTQREAYAVIPATEAMDVALTVQYRGPISAPIAKGARIAELQVRVDGKPVGRLPLYAGADVAKASFLDRLRNGFMSLLS